MSQRTETVTHGATAQANAAYQAAEAAAVNTSSSHTALHNIVLPEELPDWERNLYVPDPPRQSGLRSMIAMWSRPFTRAHRVPVFKRVWLYLALMGAYTVAVDWIVGENFSSKVMKEAGAASFGGIILGLLLVFRTNSAYERWWEGRKLWGQLINDTRNLCLKVHASTVTNEGEKKRLGDLLVSFAYALKHHLRATTPSKPLPGVYNYHFCEAGHLPVQIARQLFDVILRWKKEGVIDGFALLQMDPHIRSLMDVAGGCERIKNSPIAISYRAFMRQGIALNLLALPWYLVQEFSIFWCLPLILIGTYFLIGIELIAEDIEDPFGYDGDDLPLDNLCLTVKKTVAEILEVRQEQQFTRSIALPQVDLLKEPVR